MRYLLFALLLLTAPAGQAQDCEQTISGTYTNEYTQKEHSTGSSFNKSITGEIWVNMTGGYLYANLMFKDTTNNVTLRSASKSIIAQFSFSAGKTYAVYLPDAGINNITGVPISSNPQNGMRIFYHNNATDTTIEQHSYVPMLSSFMRERLVFISYGAAADETTTVTSNTYGCILTEAEAAKVQAAVTCILKATQ